MDQNRMRQLAGVIHSRPGFDEADATGEVQKAIMGYLKKGAAPVAVTDMVRHPSFRGMHFGRVQKAVEVLAKKGSVKTASDPREGLTVALAEAVLGEDAQVGKTILQQMGGAGRIQVMLGAKNILLLDNGVSFRWPNKERSKGNAVRITLDPSDTYTMEFLNVSGSSAKSVKKYTDVYNDQLVDIFEKQTGWYLSLGGGKKAASGRTPGPEVDPSNVTSKSVASTKHASGSTFWTVSAIDGTFPTLDAAKKAWFSAGKPKPHGSSVWATEYRGEKTLQTITLNPSMESKLDELRALLGEKKAAKKEGDSEWGETEGCECEEEDDECECAEEVREFSEDQVETILMAEDTPDLVRHCVGAVGKEYGDDVKKAFAICTAQLQKAGYLKPDSMELTAAGKAKEKEHDAEKGAGKKFGDYEKMLAKARAEGVQGYKLPFYARTKTSDGEQWFRATGTLKNGNFSGTMLDAGAAGRSSAKAKKASLDAKWAKQSWDEVEADEVPAKVKAALGEDVEDCGCADPLEELLQSVRDLVEGQTYAKAQADIMAGLEKDGWKVKKTGPDGKPMKVPHATSPNGDFKLFFKAQAIYKTHGQGDLGNARSLHLPDIRKSTYADFGAALSRWTGQDTKGNPLPKKGAVAVQPGDWDKAVAQVKSDPKHQMTPDQYHQKHGECPDGYHFDGSSKRCVKTKTEASEMQRLAGINRYPDRTLSEGAPVPRSMTAMVGEIRKYATGSLHPDWVVADEAAVAVGTGSPSGDGPLGSGSLEDGKGFQCMECGKKFKSVKSAENAQENGCPKCGSTDIDLAEAEEDRTDLWHPDKDVKNPGLPMDKDKAKSAAPADKGSALLKALKCPPGKEAKLVFGRPSCAPVAKS